MYIPSAYREDRTDILCQVIAARSFGTLITQNDGGIEITHLPFGITADASGAINLLGHIAKANTQWRDLMPGSEAIASFIVDDAYISPNWYPSKALTGKAVPTWNYIAIEVRGALDIITDAEPLLAVLEHLTTRLEGFRAQPWRITDAPSDYIAAMLQAIVGFKITVSEIKGAWKLDQRRSAADRAGAVIGLRADQTAPLNNGIASAMSDDFKQSLSES